MDLVRIGRYIAEKRKDVGLTQRELAEKLGMSDKSVSKWERGVCLPDVTIYSELCGILGISLNEFLAGEDISGEEIVQKSEDNLIRLSAESKRRLNVLKRIIALLIAAALLFSTLFALQLWHWSRPQNYIVPLDDESPEMKTAELLSGIDGAFLYRYKSTDGYRWMTLYVSEYRSGVLLRRDKVAVSYGELGSPAEGVLALIPDFENFVIKITIADGSGKFYTELPILEGVSGRKYFARSRASIEGEKQIRHGEEQGLLALFYSEKSIRAISPESIEAGEIAEENDYTYYFSFQFNK